MDVLKTFGFLCILALASGATLGNNEFMPHMSLDNGTEDGQERWGYVDVREGSHMFWWLYYTYHTDGYLNRPWVIWLQGGPGSSSCGYGNFELLGPLDLNLNDREETWVKSATILFLDQPVGTGYSYVDDPQYYTTDNLQIAQDMIEWIKVFLTNYPDFQTIPLYIFGESYGGKMGSEFAYELWKAIGAGDVTANLQGIANGNAWISPEDSIMEWGPHLYYMSNLDDPGYVSVNNTATNCQAAIHAGEWQQATNLWAALEGVVWQETNQIDFYNILRYTGAAGVEQDFTTIYYNLPKHKDPAKMTIDPVVHNINRAPFTDDTLDDLMNGEIRNKLQIIPDNVTWDGQGGEVFEYLNVDFMKPVVDVLDQILAETDLELIVYQGSLDLICLTKGAMNFVNKLTWSDLANYQSAAKQSFNDPNITDRGQTELFAKAYENFKFYWVINAGHMVPRDSPAAARRMLERVIYDVDR